jgi:hypothetical protein
MAINTPVTSPTATALCKRASNDPQPFEPQHHITYNHHHDYENTTMQSQIWSSTIPLHITHPSSTTPYLIHVPRVSYLNLLLPRLTTFYGPCSSFSYEGIPLKNLPVGLLCDLYQPPLPWRVVLGDGPLFDIHDTFINSVKEVNIRLQKPLDTGLIS